MNGENPRGLGEDPGLPDIGGQSCGACGRQVQGSWNYCPTCGRRIQHDTYQF